MDVLTRTLLSVIVVCASNFALGEPPAKKLVLQYRFSAGDFIYYDASQSMTMETLMRDARETVTNSSRARKHYRVISVDASGIALLELVLDEVQMKARFGDGVPIQFDSASSKKVPLPFRSLKKSLGKPQARVKFAKTGAVLSHRAVNGAPVGALKAAGSPLILLPEKPVAVGESWTEVFEVSVSKKVFGNHTVKQPVRLVRKYTLEKVDGDVATITFHTNTLSPVVDPAVKWQLLREMPKGTATFNISRGRLLSRRAQIDNRVVGQFGPKSTVSVKSRELERLIERTARLGKKNGGGFKRKL